MEIYSKIHNIQKWLFVTKDARNEFLKNSYVTLEQIVDKLEPLLETEKLFMFHNVVNRELITHIRDIEWEEEVISSFPMNATDPQRVGSEISYWKRYNLSAIFNIIADKDDDWNKASGIDHKTAPQSYAKTPQVQSTIKTYKTPAGQLELIEYITKIKESNDSNEISALVSEAKWFYKSEKQVWWLDKEAQERNKHLLARS